VATTFCWRRLQHSQKVCFREYNNAIYRQYGSV